ncbi:hypothetical protein Tco_1145472 [Tanacetum coccineum]
MMNGGVEYPRTQNTSPSEQTSCLGSTFIGETLRKSDQMRQNFEKSSLAMTRKLDDMKELPKSQPNRAYNEDLECDIVMVKMLINFIVYEDGVRISPDGVTSLDIVIVNEKKLGSSYEVSLDDSWRTI